MRDGSSRPEADRVRRIYFGNLRKVGHISVGVDTCVPRQPPCRPLWADPARRSTKRCRVVGEVVRHEGGDEVIAMVVARLQAQNERMAGGFAGRS